MSQSKSKKDKINRIKQIEIFSQTKKIQNLSQNIEQIKREIKSIEKYRANQNRDKAFE